VEYRLSEIDQQRFGHPTAKAVTNSKDEVTSILTQAVEDQVELLVVRVPTHALEVIQTLEAAGAFLTDTLVYYIKKKIESYVDSLSNEYSTRLATPADASTLETLAHETFRGYMGHYHADPRLEKATCDLVYSSWAGTSCADRVLADAVILIEKDCQPVAFATVKMTGESEHEGILFGVSPRQSGKGLYLSLMKLAQQWGIERGAHRMIVSTQITNVTVQKAWCRLGFEPIRSYYTLHKWFSKIQ
jgi:GNAT superfamily N-acetyltransferase